MIDLHRLAGFHLVATSGGYARAAREAPYPITQPALHQQVRKLEAELDLQLLERVGKDRMQPTAAGAELLRFVDPFFRDLPVVVRRLQANDFDGVLTMQAESLLIRQLLPGWLAAMRRRRPGAELRLTEVALPDVDELRSGRTDVIVAHLPEVPDDIAAELVARLHPSLVVPRELLGRRKRAPRFTELAEHPFLSYPSGSRHRELQMQALALHGVNPPQSIALDTADSILGFVESGLGWSLVPSLQQGGPSGRRLAAFPLERPKVTFPVYAAWRRDAPENPMLDALLETRPDPAAG